MKRMSLFALLISIIICNSTHASQRYEIKQGYTYQLLAFSSGAALALGTYKGLNNDWGIAGYAGLAYLATNYLNLYFNKDKSKKVVTFKQLKIDVLSSCFFPLIAYPKSTLIGTLLAVMVSTMHHYEYVDLSALKKYSKNLFA